MTEKEGPRSGDRGPIYTRTENGIRWRKSELIGFIGVPIDDLTSDLKKVVKFTNNFRNLLLEEDGDTVACTYPHSQKQIIEEEDKILFRPLDEETMKRNGKAGLLDLFKDEHRLEVVGIDPDTRILIVPVDKDLVKDIVADITELMEMDMEEAKDQYITDPFTNISYHTRVLMDPTGENFENDLQRARERRLNRERKEKE